MRHDEPMYDVAVIGGGPAGATAAMCCARHDLSVVLLEKDQHPRFHIGESLLPRNFTLMRELGLMHRIERAPRVRKYGASFVMGDGVKPTDFLFAPGPHGEDAETFSIERATLDRILIDAAVEAGAKVHESTAVRAITRLSDGAVELETDVGSVRARILLDASGQGTVVGRHLGVRRVLPDLRRVAYYQHFTGVYRRDGRLGGSPIIVMCTEGWFWVIPLDEKRTSVGLVMDAEVARAEKIPADRTLAWGLARSPFMQKIMRDASGPEQNYVTADFSYRCEPFAGPGYFLVGDAGAFVDPIFSTGVCMAMMSAVQAANGAAEIIAHPHRAVAVRREYIRFVDRSSGTFFDLVRDYYRHAFREMFLNGTGPLGIHRAVLAIAAGHVFPRPVWRLRWRMMLFRALLRAHGCGVRLVPTQREFSLRANNRPVAVEGSVHEIGAGCTR
jgi:flavin-dependent dehydrogenase